MSEREPEPTHPSNFDAPQHDAPAEHDFPLAGGVTGAMEALRGADDLRPDVRAYVENIIAQVRQRLAGFGVRTESEFADAVRNGTLPVSDAFDFIFQNFGHCEERAAASDEAIPSPCTDRKLTCVFF